MNFWSNILIKGLVNRKKCLINFPLYCLYVKLSRVPSRSLTPLIHIHNNCTEKRLSFLHSTLAISSEGQGHVNKNQIVQKSNMYYKICR